MFGHQSTRHIDLHLPTSWNGCTTEELEAIAAAIIQEQQRVDRYHPFDWSRVKLAVVLAINSLSPDPSPKGEGKASPPSPSPKGEGSDQPSALNPQPSDIESTWLVKRPEDKEPWPITTGQLVALTERLAWIDDEKSDKTVFRFPYPELTLDVSGKTADNKKSVTMAGPPPLLDGYTWREYRWLTDWMQEYMRCANALAQSKMEDVRRKNQAAIDTAQREFLAVLFKPAEGSMFRSAFGRLLPSGRKNVQCSMFNDFSPVKWQVILFWWSSLMGMLAKKFPRVFKSQPVGKKRRPQKADTPWDFYNRVTATIQKYVGGLSSQDVDNQPYGVTLQQLEMMADEAAEMEKIKNKK